MGTGGVMKIGVIGSGNIGSTVGALRVKAGHDVMFASRRLETLRNLVSGLGSRARAGTPADTAAFGEMVFVAVPFLAGPISRENSRRSSRVRS